jgi:YebC/PmpR family DNA-binding regulatory protein
MSGHSKWSTIKRSKDAADQKRGIIFSKLAKAITIATREGGGDEAANFKLRLVISKARQANMPKDNIKRAIESGMGTAGNDTYKEDVYEAYGPGGSALIIETLSNNVNRTIAEIKFTLSKFNGKLAERNSALRLFEKIGLITIEKESVGAKKDQLELLLIDAGAIDIEETDGALEAQFTFETLSSTADTLSKNGIQIETEIINKPYTPLTLSEKELKQIEKLIHALEELEDVETINTNVENR